MPVGRHDIRRSAIPVGQHDIRRSESAVGRHDIRRSAIAVCHNDIRRWATLVGQRTLCRSATLVGRHDIRRSATVGQHDIRRSATAVGRPARHPPVGHSGWPARHPPVNDSGRPVRYPPVGRVDVPRGDACLQRCISSLEDYLWNPPRGSALIPTQLSRRNPWIGVSGTKRLKIWSLWHGAAATVTKKSDGYMHLACNEKSAIFGPKGHKAIFGPKGHKQISRALRIGPRIGPKR